MSAEDRQPDAAAPQAAAPVEKRRGDSWDDLKLAVPALISLVLVTPLLGYYFTQLPFIPWDLGLPPGYFQWEKPPAGEEDMAVMTDRIFAQDGLVVPFEILSVLLLAALVAGVVIALREPEREA